MRKAQNATIITMNKGNFRFGLNAEAYETQLKTAGDAVDAGKSFNPRKPRFFGADAALNSRWGKTNIEGGDVGDGRRTYAPPLKTARDYSDDNQPTNVASDPSVGLGMGFSGQVPSWKSIGRRISSPRVGSFVPQHQPEESDGAENENSLGDRRTPSKFTLSPGVESTRSNLSSGSYNEDNLNLEGVPAFDMHSKHSATLLDEEVRNGTFNMYGDGDDNVFLRSHKPRWSSHETDMNFIMLFGLIFGVIVSKALQYLQLYFAWFQKQVLQVRNAFLGPCTIWEFFNFDDTRRYGVRMKLLLAPLVGACCLLHGVISFLHLSIKFLLTQAPTCAVVFVQKLYTES